MRFRNRLVTAAVWENPVADGLMHTVTFDRTYRAGEEWRTSTSFAGRDLISLAKVALEAHSWIGKQTTSTRAAEDGQGSDVAADTCSDATPEQGLP
jgi:hypothetical protein